MTGSAEPVDSADVDITSRSSRISGGSQVLRSSDAQSTRTQSSTTIRRDDDGTYSYGGSETNPDYPIISPTNKEPGVRSASKTRHPRHEDNSIRVRPLRTGLDPRHGGFQSSRTTSTGSPQERKRSRQSLAPDDGNLPDVFNNLTEMDITAPSREASKQQPSTESGADIDRYNGPDLFDNLTDISSPAPTRRSRKQQPVAKKGAVLPSHILGYNAEPAHCAPGNRISITAPRPSGRSQALVGPPSLASSASRTALPGLYNRHEASLEEQIQFTQQSGFGSKSNPSKSVQRVSKVATHIFTVSYLILFSILGTLARLGIQWLTFYPGVPAITPVLWANFAGSLFFGFLAEDQRLFRDEWGVHGEKNNTFLSEIDFGTQRRRHAKVKKTIPLYIGLATGFCGSLTSFSSFMRDGFLAISNDLPVPQPTIAYDQSQFSSSSAKLGRHNGYSVEALLAVILLTICLSLAALKAGSHISLAVGSCIPTIPFRLLRRVLDRSAVFLSLGCWLGAIIMSIWPPDRPGGTVPRSSWSAETWRGQAIFACVLAPVGCLGRFYASLYLNGISDAFPLGTFVVNIFGTAVEGMAYDLQHVSFGIGSSTTTSSMSMAGGGRVGCQVLQGVMDGFCGCLTTVSTFVGELNSLQRRHAYIYGFTSITTGVCIMVVVMGSVRWTVGWQDAACVT